MILVDTSVWIDHLRSTNPLLVRLLDDGDILSHPAVMAELALGRPRQEKLILDGLSKLPVADAAAEDEVLMFIQRHTLGGSGVGYADAHILASAMLTPDALLWTRDRRMQAVARRLDLDAEIEPYAGLQED